MNQTAKIVLLVVGIAAVYHFFFRSITPVKTSASTKDKVKGIKEALEEQGNSLSISDQEADFADIPNGYPMREFLGTQSTGEDNNFLLQNPQLTELLR
jgi:hypothetical protein